MNLILIQPTLHAAETKFNLDAIENLVTRGADRFAPDDILLLPEHYSFDDEPAGFDDYVRKIARTAGCAVVGGSHHRRVNGSMVNAGIAVNAGGEEIGTYSKLRPYFDEQRVVSPGGSFGEFRIGGRNVLVLICADFWYSDLLLRASSVPDLVLVPSLSVSRKPTPDFSRSLWRHLAIARGYEFGSYIGISDWSEYSLLPRYRTCGSAGFADPTAHDPSLFFTPVGSTGLSVHPLDFDALAAFREDRRMRGFFWK